MRVTALVTATCAATTVGFVSLSDSSRRLPDESDNCGGASHNKLLSCNIEVLLHSI